MQSIRAFVGHSFSERDKDLIGTFLAHFKNLESAYPAFSWDHAEEAEPLPLSEKVLAKVAGKNVFIAICTKSERSSSAASFFPAFFANTWLKVKSSDLQWKASDWIIQEIGMAVGREMSLIVFLEEGVRPPGGLYGNLEYIPFSRSNPHASFDKFLQMLVSLTPKEASGTEADSKADVVEKKSDVVEPAGDDWEPGADWTQEKYEEAMVRMLMDGDKDGLDVISAAFKASQFAHGDAADEWDARIEWLRIALGEEADLEKLKKLVTDKPQSSALNYYLGRSYSQFGEPLYAARAFSAAADAASDDKKKISYQADAAIQYFCAGEPDRAIRIFEELKADTSQKPELNQLLLSDLRNLAQRLKDDELEIAILEQMVALKPGDASLRFQLAYKHSEFDNKDMAFHHYMKIPAPQRDAVTWNNIGVSYAGFDMPVKSIDAYLVSERDGETLAMANIGFKLLGAGFIDEAKKRAVAAQAVGKYHVNINDLLKRIDEVRGEEEIKRDEVLDKVAAKAAFYRELGVAASAAEPRDLNSRWKSPDMILESKASGVQVRFVGKEERDANSLVGIFAGQSPSSKKVVHRTQIVARIRGRMLVGEIKRTRDGEQPGLGIGPMDSKSTLLMYLDAEGAKIHVMEGRGSAVPNFYIINRVP